MNMKYDVLSVGSPRMDVFVRLPDVEVESLCSIDKKKCVIELGFGDKIAVRGVEFAVGGNAGNNAVGLSRLGYKSAIVGSVGDQAVDEQVLQSLREEGGVA
jgi:sugar/nucleoside kinase (ribokinase family)